MVPGQESGQALLLPAHHGTASEELKVCLLIKVHSIDKIQFCRLAVELRSGQALLQPAVEPAQQSLYWHRASLTDPASFANMISILWMLALLPMFHAALYINALIHEMPGFIRYLPISCTKMLHIIVIDACDKCDLPTCPACVPIPCKALHFTWQHASHHFGAIISTQRRTGHPTWSLSFRHDSGLASQGAQRGLVLCGRVVGAQAGRGGAVGGAHDAGVQLHPVLPAPAARHLDLFLARVPHDQRYRPA